jgi:DNA gyrase subunit A
MAEDRIIPVNIEEEMKTAYIDYSMSVIISRALPDVRDGLKPVHRRVLFGMHELGVNYNKPYKKSARIVGEVLGKFHPHGDQSVYDAMVRMAQPWSLRYPLVDGQGNFGSMDGDSPAAMRYTEVRFKRIAEEMLSDISKDTVNFQSNFDDSLQEPTVLPSRIPNLLINGTTGIAVGMATNMPPHNLTEVCEGIIAYIDNNDITVDELMAFVKGPDFPTGAMIYGSAGVKTAAHTGRGRIVMRANAIFETSKTGKDQIVVSSVPYMVNKAMMIQKTAELVNEKKIDGISDIRDESDKEGVRVVYDLKRDAIPSVVLNNLYKQTQLQSSFGVNNVVLVGGRPLTLNLKDMIHEFVEFRHEVVVRRTKYELNEAEKRAHILQGYLIALDNLDEVIKLIRESRDPDTAQAGLIERFGLSEIQSKAILEMRLQRLTGMERDKIVKEYDEIMATIKYLNEILDSIDLRMGIIKKETTDIKDRYGDARRTEIIYAAEEFTDEDMIPDDEMVITISHQGYIKRTLLSEYRTQGRGGVGSRGATTKEEDFTEHLFFATNHNYLLIFTDKGKVYWLKVWELPEGGKTAKGRALQNLIQITKDEKVKAVLIVKSLSDEEYINNTFIVMCTKGGTIKKTKLEAYSRPRQNGIIAINIGEEDQLLDVKLTSGQDEIFIATRQGKAIRFNESKVRPMGRTATGVKGVNLDNAEVPNEVVGLVTISDPINQNLLVIAEEGYGKRSDMDQYRITNRGGKGVRVMNVTEKTGKLVTILDVTDQEDLMIITKNGITIRMEVSALRVIGRATQGVKLIRLSDGDQISSIAKVPKNEEAEIVAPEPIVLDELDALEPLDDTEETEGEEPEEDTEADATDEPDAE